MRRNNILGKLRSQVPARNYSEQEAMELRTQEETLPVSQFQDYPGEQQEEELQEERTAEVFSAVFSGNAPRAQAGFGSSGSLDEIIEFYFSRREVRR